MHLSVCLCLCLCLFLCLRFSEALLLPVCFPCPLTHSHVHLLARSLSIRRALSRSRILSCSRSPCTYTHTDAGPFVGVTLGNEPIIARYISIGASSIVHGKLASANTGNSTVYDKPASTNKGNSYTYIYIYVPASIDLYTYIYLYTYIFLFVM